MQKAKVFGFYVAVITTLCLLVLHLVNVSPFADPTSEMLLLLGLTCAPALFAAGKTYAERWSRHFLLPLFSIIIIGLVLLLLYTRESIIQSGQVVNMLLPLLFLITGAFLSGLIAEK
ncbi:hypothetical protein [Schleiferilactobacillus harbinensis]|uniref:TIGR04086 family membrane protein n=1 Tax=Schleiferilactobacillus harbinensis TaxID=304207 RepID=A0ABU7SZ76_9LACO